MVKCLKAAQRAQFSLIIVFSSRQAQKEITTITAT